MEVTKIRLSPEETGLVQNADWILTKNRVMQKVISLFSQLQPRLESLITRHPGLPAEVRATMPKISRGENYEGLPWVMLDYPRYFVKENTCAIRTFFWWGKFFSCTLQLSGKYKTDKLQNILGAYESLGSEGFSVCINDDPWLHHFGTGNYQPVGQFSPAAFALVCEKPFIKLAKSFPLSEWDEVETKLPATAGKLLDILK